MTLPLTNYHLIDDSNARVIYGKYHPKDWHAVESYLVSNPDWYATLFSEKSKDMEAAILGAAQLNILRAYNVQKYFDIVKSSILACKSYRTKNAIDTVKRQILKNAFELALFKTLVMPDAADPEVITSYCDWKLMQILQISKSETIIPLEEQKADTLLGATVVENYWSNLCEPGLDPLELNPDYPGRTVVINFDDLS